MTAGSLRTSSGRALGEHRALLEAVHAVADRRYQRQVVLDDEHRRRRARRRTSRSSGAIASDSRWAMPAIGSSSSTSRRTHGEQARELDDPAGAGGQLAGSLVGPRGRARPRTRISSASAGSSRSSRTAGGNASSDGMSSVRRWTRARPARTRGPSGAGRGGPSGTIGRGRAAPDRTDETAEVVAEQDQRCPVDGTKPPMAFINVVLPAPLEPISPTISPRPDVEVDVVDDAAAAELDDEVRRRRGPAGDAALAGRAVVGGRDRRPTAPRQPPSRRSRRRDADGPPRGRRPPAGTAASARDRRATAQHEQQADAAGRELRRGASCRAGPAPRAGRSRRRSPRRSSRCRRPPPSPAPAATAGLNASTWNVRVTPASRPPAKVARAPARPKAESLTTAGVTVIGRGRPLVALDRDELPPMPPARTPADEERGDGEGERGRRSSRPGTSRSRTGRAAPAPRSPRHEVSAAEELEFAGRSCSPRRRSRAS